MTLRWSPGAFWKATSTSSVVSAAPSVAFTNPPIWLLNGLDGGPPARAPQTPVRPPHRFAAHTDFHVLLPGPFHHVTGNGDERRLPCSSISASQSAPSPPRGASARLGRVARRNASTGRPLLGRGRYANISPSGAGSHHSRVPHPASSTRPSADRRLLLLPPSGPGSQTMSSAAPRGSCDSECGQAVGEDLKRRHGSYARGCAGSGPRQAKTSCNVQPVPMFPPPPYECAPLSPLMLDFKKASRALTEIGSSKVNLILPVGFVLWRGFFDC